CALDTICSDRAIRKDRRTQTNPGLIGPNLQYHSELPFGNVAQRNDLGDVNAPVLSKLDGCYRLAEALGLVVGDQAVHQRLARIFLQLGLKRGADRQASTIKLVFAV